MLALSRWKIILVTLAVLFGVVFTLPNVLPQSTLDSLPGWAPTKKLNLGLDLAGGSSLLMEVDTKALKAERLTNLLEDVRNNLRQQNVAFDNLHQQGDAVAVHVMNAGDCWLQPQSIVHKVLDYSDGCEVLEIVLPADFKTVELEK